MFDSIFEAIEEWMRELLTGMVQSNLTTMFTAVFPSDEPPVSSLFSAG